MTQSKSAGVESVDAATVHGWMEDDAVVLVDVRETTEFEQEHIPGAMLLPMSKFDPELFPTVPGKKVVLHCAVGKRSESAGKMLLNEGHAGALHMAGGIEAWKAAGFATEVQFVPPAADEPAAKAEPVQFVRLCPPPGQVLKEEYLEPLKIGSRELAARIGVDQAVVDAVVGGETVVDVELSLRLARFFSTAADFWVHLQIEHDLELARQKIGETIRREIRPRTASD